MEKRFFCRYKIILLRFELLFHNKLAMSKGISSSQKRKSKKELIRCFFKDEWEEKFYVYPISIFKTCMSDLFLSYCCDAKNIICKDVLKHCTMSSTLNIFTDLPSEQVLYLKKKLNWHLNKICSSKNSKK